jgi:hypothetical protein
MPFFYLKLRRGSEDLPNDPEPQKFPNLEAARIDAVEAIRELSASQKYDGIDILDHRGKLLITVTTREALCTSVKKPKISK